MKIALITQLPGHVTQIDEKGILHEGNRSCALYEYEHKKLHNRVTQYKIADIEIRGDNLYYKNTPLDLSGFDAVVRRAWDGATNSLKSLEILRLIEKQYPQIYPDNPSKGITITVDKTMMQHALETAGVPTPKTLVYHPGTTHSPALLQQDLHTLAHSHTDDESSTTHPTFVLKQQHGTQGKTIQMFRLNKIDELIKAILSYIADNIAVVIQEYIAPVIPPTITGIKAAAHYRIIMSATGTGYNVIGGKQLARSNSWISNSHHSEGQLFETELNILEHTYIPVIANLCKIGNHTGMQQFGADVLIDKHGKHYVLEINDSMGISGDMLESQQVPMHYAKSLHDRASRYHQYRCSLFRRANELQLAEKLRLKQPSVSYTLKCLSHL
jgi:glutathione synthase/RimK-type ligase-like ATP-grasp enzyme